MDFSDKYPNSPKYPHYYIEKMMYEMENSPAQKFLRDYENSIEMRILKENSQLQKTLALFDSENSLRKMAESFIPDFQNIPGMRILEDNQKIPSEVLNDYTYKNSEFFDWLDRFNNSSLSRIHEQLSNSASRLIEDTIKQSGFDKHFGPDNIYLSAMMKQLEDSSIIDTMTEFNNLPFQNEDKLSRFLQNHNKLSPADFIVEDDDGLIFDPEVIEEIENEKNRGKDFNKLSQRAQRFIVFLGGLFYDLVKGIIISLIITSYHEDIQKLFQYVENKIEIIQILNDPPIEINTSLLADYCVIASKNHALRAEPKLESNTLTQVSIGKVCEVIEKKEDWLKIEVEPVDPSDEMIVGWILKTDTILFCELDVKSAHE